MVSRTGLDTGLATGLDTGLATGLDTGLDSDRPCLEL